MVIPPPFHIAIQHSKSEENNFIHPVSFFLYLSLSLSSPPFSFFLPILLFFFISAFLLFVSFTLLPTIHSLPPLSILSFFLLFYSILTFLLDSLIPLFPPSYNPFHHFSPFCHSFRFCLFHLSILIFPFILFFTLVALGGSNTAWPVLQWSHTHAQWVASIDRREETQAIWCSVTGLAVTAGNCHVGCASPRG